jgi:uncharacterized protein YdeI (YjbR/CyaY-like superfamily)
MQTKVDEYLNGAKNWRAELSLLRQFVLDCQLTETFKWRVPCYTFNGKNIVIIAPFKNYCALNFFKGVFLQDENKILIKPGENTQAGRLIRFTNLDEIRTLETTIKAYIFEAIEVEKVGLKIENEKIIDVHFCEELEETISKNQKFKVAFEALTPGRQRAYNIYFSDPLQSKTRTARIIKLTPKILKGKGFNDCICGLSKKMPNCDGSHKYILK